jgi:hypothetical protein
MSDRLAIDIVFHGEPFDRQAVVHTLRHLAMRSGWTITSGARHRILYATTDDPAQITAAEGDVVILSTPAVGMHLATGNHPFPIENMLQGRLPFPHPRWRDFEKAGWIGADIVAGACAVLNLWYEGHLCSRMAEDWILFAEDWWQPAGWKRPEPVADRWLDVIAGAASFLGWPRMDREKKPTILLTHDVDYLPTPFNFGFPRFLRSLARQIVIRRRPGDALAVLSAYARALMQSRPYCNFGKVVAGERVRGGRSSFQFVARRDHENDPAYDLDRPWLIETLRFLREEDFEICLHGSYRTGDDPSRLAEEKAELERRSGQKIVGHRQHYLHFHPPYFFLGIEDAGLRYDMSVGYNDKAGPRAGTCFPYRPYDLRRGRPFSFWEFPLILMDTTLATGYCLSPEQAALAAREELQGAVEAGGCVSLIWHQEQMGGLLDPGFDRVYWNLLDDLRQKQVRMTSGCRVLPELDAEWHAAIN